MNKNCGIYKVTSPTGRIYIGQAKDIKARWRGYYGLYSLVKGQVKLYRSFIKHGVYKHTFEVIEDCNIEELNSKERYWQDFYDVLNGGLNCILQEAKEKPRVISDEVKNKMSYAQKGTKSHLYGKKLPKETRDKMSKRQLGQKNHMFGRFKELHHNYQKNITDETRGRMSKSAKKANLNLEAGFAAKLLIDIETGVFYYSITEAAKIYNISYSHLIKMLNGDRVNKTNLRRC